MKKTKSEEEYQYGIVDAIYSTKLKELFSDSWLCMTATLYRDCDGNIFIFRHWLNQGAGPDHSSDIVKSVGELRRYLLEDAKYGRLSKDTVEKLCIECQSFFEK